MEFKKKKLNPWTAFGENDLNFTIFQCSSLNKKKNKLFGNARRINQLYEKQCEKQTTANTQNYRNYMIINDIRLFEQFFFWMKNKNKITIK